MQQRTRRGPPPTLHLGPHQATSFPVWPDHRASAPPLPPVPLGLPPGRLLPRWGPAACSPATAPGAGSAWGRGYAGGGAGPEGAGRARAGRGGKRSGAGGDCRLGRGQPRAGFERLP